ncbi:MAG: hypothetical protein RMM10_11230, partial [Anaerolineae bacterium]
YEEFAAHRQEFLAYRQETDRRFAELAEAQRRHYEEFAAHRQEFLAYRQETDRRFAELAEALRRLIEQVEGLRRRADDHARDIGELKTMRLEALYREEAASLFRGLLRRATVVPSPQKNQILDQAVEAGRITLEEADRAAAVDLLVEGFHRREDRRLFLAVEISFLGSDRDVRRAAERAAIFARALQTEVWAVVASKDLTGPARRAAHELGVWWVQDGRAFRPDEVLTPEPEEE